MHMVIAGSPSHPWNSPLAIAGRYLCKLFSQDAAASHRYTALYFSL